MVEDAVAALAQRCLCAEVCDDVDEPVAQPGDLQSRGDPLHQAQRVHIPPNVIQQRTCNRISPLLTPSPSHITLFLLVTTH